MKFRQSSQLLFTAIVALCVATYASNSSADEQQEAHSAAYDVLKKDVGHWDTITELWPAPDAQPIVSKGVEKARMVGKYWLIYEFEGEMGGEPFAGFGKFGYDAKKKKYIGTWVDSSSPNLGITEGTWDEAKQALTMYSTSLNSVNEADTKTKMIATYQDKDHRKFEMFDQVDGKADQWQKTMEINYTRRKPE